MHTLGFDFKPWTEAKAIADGPSIRKYVNETADEYGVRQHIRFNTKIVAADWSNADQVWHVTSENVKTGERSQTTARFLFMCGGYYRYDQGYRPEFPNEQAFKGKMLHPQHWPEDLDYTGKKVVVIGSGATAMTLVPAMSDKAAHVTMLQRSPTYVVSRPAVDGAANFLRKILPAQWAYNIIRWRNVLFQQFFFGQTRKNPQKARERLIGMVREELGPDFDVDKHFNPAYNPWEQRLCLVPDSDLFNALKSGKASVETDHIERFTETGILLKSGKTLEADIIVTATGLNLIFTSGVPANVTLFIALAMAVVVWALLWRTRLGYAIRAFGKSEAAARYAGISPFAIIMVAMLISGGLAGMMAINNVMGEAERLLGNSASGAGFIGIAVALMGRNHPVGVVLAALLFGFLFQGGAELGLWTKIPIEMRTVVQGLVILFTGALDMMVRMLLTWIFNLFRAGKMAKGVA
jgi:hypothetical protein